MNHPHHGSLLIVQCFNEHVNDIILRLPHLATHHHVTHIQISPVQQHCVHIWGQPWYRVYQPSGLTIGNSLGSRNDIQRLIERAREHNISIVVDIVLHHRCYCPFCNFSGAWGAFSKNVRRYWQRGDHSHHDDVSRLSLSFYDSHDPRYNFNGWGWRQDVTLRSTLDAHAQFLRDLVEMGVGGFRFDAIKHIPASYIEMLLHTSQLHNNHNNNSNHLLIYGEALDGDASVCSEYLIGGDHHHDGAAAAGMMKVFDFPQTFSMMDALRPGGDIRPCMEKEALPWQRIISVADCHDSILGDSYKFGDRKDGILAISLLLARGRGIPLVYFTFIDDPTVSAAIRFYHLAHGCDFSVDHDHSTPTLLVLRRGDRGLVICNKAGEWYETGGANMSFINSSSRGIRGGTYTELRYGFHVDLHDGDDGRVHIHRWGDEEGSKTMKIGPRDILFLWRNQ
eukprot:TRINITY_DN9160_c0_g1_i1.p1 TRINITY_DN9160_c0_g1~~TRINITY_DN9160_c0_g1_i1.p1  ORF type:complete len:451 (-),score=53.28 TRINITY_DN9160_c0_g1_i1:25-1377(-)